MTDNSLLLFDKSRVPREVINKAKRLRYFNELESFNSDEWVVIGRSNLWTIKDGALEEVQFERKATGRFENKLRIGLGRWLIVTREDEIFF